MSRERHAHHLKAEKKSVSKIGLKVGLDENNPHLYKIKCFFKNLASLADVGFFVFFAIPQGASFFLENPLFLTSACSFFLLF